MSSVPTRLENTCEGCGKAYRPYQKTQRFCSKGCKHVAARKPIFDATALAAAVTRWLMPVDGETA